MKRNKLLRWLPVVVVILVLVLLQTNFALAQCPMCRAAAESSIKEGGKHALGLNAGIMYLFLTPYIIVATLGLLWWRNNRKVSREAQQ